MATLPKISVSCVDLADLFDEEVRLLQQAGWNGPEEDQDMEVLEREQEALRRRRREVAMDLARLDDDIEAAQCLIDEAVLGPFVARQLARERAAQKARME